MRPFLDERTANKIKIYSNNEIEESKNALLNVIDADQLPACYGGTMTDPDGNPNCVTKVRVVSLIIQFQILIDSLLKITVQHGR